MECVQIIAILLTIQIWQSQCIITAPKTPQRTFRRHVAPAPAPPTNWEAGLREAIHQSLLREHHQDSALRGHILSAPLLGRHDTATPFGDVAVLARGQLYATEQGYQLVQEHQHEPWSYHQHHNHLLALWTVKRIRHRNHHGHYFEIEYTISPINSELSEHLSKTNEGYFNYNIPGHVFVIKSDPQLNHAYYLNDNAEKHQHLNEHGIVVGTTAEGYQQVLHRYPAFFSSYHPETTDHTTIDPKEYELYKKLIESLAAKTTHRFTGSTGTTTTSSTTTIATTRPTYDQIATIVPIPQSSFVHFPEEKVVPLTENTITTPIRFPTTEPITTLHYYTPIEEPKHTTAPMIPTTTTKFTKSTQILEELFPGIKPTEPMKPMTELPTHHSTKTTSSITTELPTYPSTKTTSSITTELPTTKYQTVPTYTTIKSSSYVPKTTTKLPTTEYRTIPTFLTEKTSTSFAPETTTELPTTEYFSTIKTTRPTTVYEYSFDSTIKNEITQPQTMTTYYQNKEQTTNLIPTTSTDYYTQEENTDAKTRIPTETSTSELRDTTPTESFLQDDQSKSTAISSSTKKDVDNDDIFGTIKTSTTQLSSTSPKPQTTQSDLAVALFGSNRRAKQIQVISQLTPTSTEPSKIIYSDFYRPSTQTPTTVLDTTTGTLYESTTRADGVTELRPVTDQSISTSISFEVNKKENHQEVDVNPGVMTELRGFTPEGGAYTIYRATMPESPTTEESTLEMVESKKVFDDVALQLVNHARSIDYLNKKPTATTKQKYARRRSHTAKKVRKSRRRNDDLKQ